MDDQLNPAKPLDPPETAWIAERRALSREMHDDVAHSILILMSTLEHVELHQETWEPTARRSFSDAREIAAATLEKVRALASRLRQRDSGGHHDPAPRAGTVDVPAQLSYVLQEAVANALAHSNARQVVVDVQQSPGRVTAVVADDGSGFEPERLAPHERVGLLSMHERAALVGGRLQIDTAQQSGTRVTIHVPSWNVSHGGR